MTSGHLKIDKISFEDEFLRFRNTGNESFALTGYTIVAQKVELYTFPKFVIGAGNTVTVHLGAGKNTVTDLYGGYNRSVPQIESYTLIVKNADGTPVIKHSS